MNRLERLFVVALVLAIVTGPFMLGCYTPGDALVGRFELLGLHKPKGIAFTFDTVTGVVSTTPLPASMRTPTEGSKL